MERDGLWKRLSAGNRFFCIAGPCVIEGQDMCDQIADRCLDICGRLGIEYVFKASFDKANRTSIHSFRGPGMDAGLATLRHVREKFDVPALTDIHTISQVDTVSHSVEILQIPAFLCRQTDLLVAAAETGAIINVKKGQFLAPWDMKPVVEKLAASDNKKIILTERGSSFGYNNLVADMRSIPVMSALGYPVVFDATHSVQLPGGGGDKSSGNGEYAPVLARAAVAAGAHGVFIETHPNPAEAQSDGPNMIPLDKLEETLKTLKNIFEVVRA